MMTLMPRSVRSATRRPAPRRNPYEKFRGRELTLTDYLAIDRTVLANERTALAYARTALAMIVIGGTAIKFFTQWYMWAIGGVFIAGAAVVGAIGARRYLATARSLATALEQQTGDPGHPLRDKDKDKDKDTRDTKENKDAKATAGNDTKAPAKAAAPEPTPDIRSDARPER